jgi:hypothetical protein
VQTTYIETFRTDETGFLADGKDDVDVATRNLRFFNDAQDFANDSNAALIVTSQNGPAVGA